MKNNKARSKLRLVLWNRRVSEDIVDNIGSYIKDSNYNVGLVINESPHGMVDLSSIGMIGYGSTNVKSRGLCFYLSSALRNYVNIYHSTWCIYGTISLPKVGKLEPVVLGFVATYRSPNLSTDENLEFFNDLEGCVSKLLLKSTSVCVMGDMNANDRRFC